VKAAVSAAAKTAVLLFVEMGIRYSSGGNRESSLAHRSARYRDVKFWGLHRTPFTAP
jgi:hypothetical protein